MGDHNEFYEKIRDGKISVGFQFNETGEEVLVWLRGLFKGKTKGRSRRNGDKGGSR